MLDTNNCYLRVTLCCMIDVHVFAWIRESGFEICGCIEGNTRARPDASAGVPERVRGRLKGRICQVRL